MPAVALGVKTERPCEGRTGRVGRSHQRIYPRLRRIRDPIVLAGESIHTLDQRGSYNTITKCKTKIRVRSLRAYSRLFQGPSSASDIQSTPATRRYPPAPAGPSVSQFSLHLPFPLRILSYSQLGCLSIRSDLAFASLDHCSSFFMISFFLFLSVRCNSSSAFAISFRTLS